MRQVGSAGAGDTTYKAGGAMNFVDAEKVEFMLRHANNGNNKPLCMGKRKMFNYIITKMQPTCKRCIAILKSQEE